MTDRAEIVDLERGLIAAALTQTSAVVALGEEAGLSGAAFARKSLGEAWDAIAERAATGAPVDAGLIAVSLNQPAHEDRLRDLQTNYLTPVSVVPEYIGRVLTAAAVRRAHETGLAFTSVDLFDAADTPAEVAQIVDAQVERFQASLTGGRMSGGVRSGDAIRDILLPDIERRMAGDVEQFNLGFADLDEAVTLEPGNVVGVIARQGNCKSLFALAVAIHTARSTGKLVGFVSLEMSQLEVHRRMVACVSGVPSEYMKHPERGLTGDHMDRIERAAETVAGWPIHVFTAEDFNTLEAVTAQAKLMARDGLGMLVVDYWQLLETAAPGPRDDRRQLLDRVSRRFKLLAAELGIVVVLCAQVNRNAAGEDRPPFLWEVRDSDALGNDASVIVGLHLKRAVEDNDMPAGTSVLQVAVRKNRDSSLVEVELAAQLEVSRLRDLANFGRAS